VIFMYKHVIFRCKHVIFRCKNVIFTGAVFSAIVEQKCRHAGVTTVRFHRTNHIPLCKTPDSTSYKTLGSAPYAPDNTTTSYNALRIKRFQIKISGTYTCRQTLRQSRRYIIVMKQFNEGRLASSTMYRLSKEDRIYQHPTEITEKSRQKQKKKVRNEKRSKTKLVTSHVTRDKTTKS